MKSFSIGVLLVCLVWAMPATAQVRLAEIAGTITDESAAVLPGVTVTVTHVATSQKRSGTTGATGHYVFTNLAIGVYEIRAELSGFNTVVMQDVALGIGESVRADVKMKVATLNETVTVKGEAPLVDPTKSDLAGRIDQQQVQNLPLSGRNWMNLAAMAPGVKSEASGGQPTAGVGGTQMSKVYLDGASVMNLSTVAVDMDVSKDIIAEFEVITNRFDAVMGRAGTAVTNAVTKSGTDAVHGSGFFYLRDDKLNATDFFTNRVEPYSNKQFGGTLGGPIIKGKTHFFGSYERQVEPKTLSANTRMAAYDQPVDSPITRNLYFGRIDHSLTANHRLSVRYNRLDLEQPNQGVGGLTTLSSAANARYLIYRVNAGLSSVFSGKFVNQVTFTYMNSTRKWARVDPGSQYSFPSFAIGGPPAGIGREHPVFTYVRDDASYVFGWRGQHSMKFGGEYQHGNVTGEFLSSSNGSFFFNQDPANLATCCAGPDESKWDKSMFPIPVRFTQALGDYSITSPNNIYSAYVQDNWTINPRLTLNLGLRYDLEIGALANDQTGLVVEPHKNDADNVQPRVGFAYDPGGNGKTVIRGGAGLYYDQVFSNITFNQRRTNTGQQVTVTEFNTTNSPNFINNPLGGKTFEDYKNLITSGVVNVARISSDAKQPNVWSWSVGIARQLPGQIALSVDYVGQRSDSMLRSVDSNLFCCQANGLPWPIRSGTYLELGGFVAAQPTSNGRPDTRFNAIQNYLTVGKSRYHGLQMALMKRWSRNYQFGVSYLLSKNMDNHNGAFSYPYNMFNLDDEYSYSLQDQRHHFVANYVVRLPFKIDFSGIVSGGSGRHVNPTTGGADINGDGQAGGDRPTCGLDARFNPGCAALGVSNGTRVERNSLLTASTFKVDVRISRKITLKRVEIDPGFEMFNLFNRRNYDPATYNPALSNTGFGKPGRSSALPYLPFQAQLGVRVTF